MWRGLEAHICSESATLNIVSWLLLLLDGRPISVSPLVLSQNNHSSIYSNCRLKHRQVWSNREQSISDIWRNKAYCQTYKCMKLCSNWSNRRKQHCRWNRECHRGPNWRRWGGPRGSRWGRRGTLVWYWRFHCRRILHSIQGAPIHLKKHVIQEHRSRPIFCLFRAWWVASSAWTT